MDPRFAILNSATIGSSYEQLVKELLEEYWHPQGPVPGGTWWEARFRRSIGDARPGPRRNAV